MANFTQDAILKTFSDLLEASPFEKITVSTLIRECNISRNTFYYHYPDIYALLDDWISKSLGKYSALEDDGSWQENMKGVRSSTDTDGDDVSSGDGEESVNR